MNEENTKKLFEKYPKLYAQKDLPNTASLMCYGFPGNGWFNLIDDLSADLQDTCDRYGVQIEAVQVKSKWGGMRYYYGVKDLENIEVDDTFLKEINQLIKTAESKSFDICQGCANIKEEENKNQSYCQTCKYKTQLL